MQGADPPASWHGCPPMSGEYAAPIVSWETHRVGENGRFPRSACTECALLTLQLLLRNADPPASWQGCPPMSGEYAAR